jgi:hypothetical protein
MREKSKARNQAVTLVDDRSTALAFSIRMDGGNLMGDAVAIFRDRRRTSFHSKPKHQ